jgi:hypothetical protein
MVRACSSCGGRCEMRTKFWFASLKGRGRSENQCVNVRNILNGSYGNRV